MRSACWLSLLAVVLAAALPRTEAAPMPDPISLHPENPRYFLFRGRPTVLVTSAEHYGAVLNRAFDTTLYLDTLRTAGFNLTRVFTGAYVEPAGAFKIQHNTLAPAPGAFLAPWARSETPGCTGGGSRFDLKRWDEEYFRRLRGFCRDAGERGIAVEVVLFCPYYDQRTWEYSPLHPANNVNGIGEAVPRTEVLTLKHPALLAVQDDLIRKIAAELAELDNVYYEICNEPYFGGVTAAWQEHVITVLRAGEAGLPAPHMIAQNIANGASKVEKAHPAVSLLNFHYASPPDAVALNAPLHRAVGFDETGFKGTGDARYRTDGWEFMLAGGAVYNHLDYSFTVEHPDGTAPVTDPTPGGGGPGLRRQLGTLKRFVESFDFLRLAPAANTVRGPAGITVRALAGADGTHAVYLKGGTQAELTLELPAGTYLAEWWNPRTGVIDRRKPLRHGGGALQLASPEYVEDLALRLTLVTTR